MRAVCVCGRYFNGRQPSGLSNISTAEGEGGGGGGGGGAYARDKNTSARFCAKNAGARGGVFAGHYGTVMERLTFLFCSLTFCSLRNNKISADGVLVLAGTLIVNRNLKLE